MARSFRTKARLRVGIDARFAEEKLTGIGKYIKLLSLSLSKKGIRIVLFYSRKPKVEIYGKNISSAILPSLNNLFFEQFSLPRALSARKVDLYHAAGNIGVPLFNSCCLVLTVHDLIPLMMKNYFKHSRFKYLSKLLYFSRMAISVYGADRIIVDSQFTQDSLVKIFKASSLKIKIIYLGISKPRGRRLFRKIISGKYILNNGGIDIRKNLPRLIKAFAKISKKFPKIKLVITGENLILRKELEVLSEKLKVSSSVVFTGYVNESELWSLIRNASCLCFPSEIEGFGFPILEGFACGVPIVASKSGSIPEVAGDAAVLVNPYSVSKVAKAIERVLRNKSLRRYLVRRGYQRVKMFSWSKCVGETVKIYEEVLESEGVADCHGFKRRKND